MNELLEEFNVSTHQYQNNARLRFNRYMAKNPMPLTVHARGVGIAHNSLLKFLRGQLVTNMVMFKIDNYLNDNEVK